MALSMDVRLVQRPELALKMAPQIIQSIEIDEELNIMEGYFPAPAILLNVGFIGGLKVFFVESETLGRRSDKTAAR